MIRLLRNFPIKFKLMFITVAISGVSLLVACTAFALYEQAAFRLTMARDMALIADMFDDDIAPGLAFNDVASMERTLEILVAHPHIVAAAVFDKAGKIAAHREGPDLDGAGETPGVQSTSQHFTAKRLDTYQDITLAGETIGVVYVGSDLHELHDRNLRYIAIVGGLLLGCSLVALLLVSRLQRIISEPIVDLALTVAAVATEKNYAVRAHKQGDDELGRLIDGFNEMLAQIQTRDAALQRAHDELEGRVQERTRELCTEIAERRRSEDALRESHQRFEMVTRATSDVIWDRDMVNDTVWRNENFQTVFGYAPGEIESSSEAWFVRVHPDDMASCLEGVRAALESGRELWTSEYRFRRSDGMYVSVLDRGHIIRNAQGLPVRMIGAMQNISALKQAQEETVRQQARFKFIFDAVPVGISLFTLNDAHTHLVNPAHERITGVSARDSSVPGAFERASHPDDYRRQLELSRAFLRDETASFSVEKRYLHPDGRIVWAALTSRKFTDPATGVVQSVTTLVDISDLKAAQEAAAREQARFRFIFEAVPVGFSWMLPANLATRIVNPAHALITGVPAERCRELDLYRMATHPEDRARQAALVEQLEAGQIDHFDIEKRYLHADGSVRWAMLAVRNYRASNGEIQEISTIVDISERKRSEAKLAEASGLLTAMLENSPDPIYFKDVKSRFVLVSRSKARKARAHLPHLESHQPGDFEVGNLSPTEQLNGLTDFDIYTADDARQAYADEQAILLSGEGIVGKLEKQMCLDGSVTWSLTSKMPWRDPQGNIVGTFGISKDVTALKETEAKLEQLHRQLMDSSRQAGMAEVATGVLHNVGNVLNSVNVSATLVMERVRESRLDNLPKLGAMLQEHAADLVHFLTDDPKGRKIPSYLMSLSDYVSVERAAIVEELGHLCKNIDHIKEVVAMQQSYAKVCGVTESVAVVELVEDALRMNAGALSRHGLDVVRDYQSRPIVTVDRHKVMQILVNLIRNAKYACDDSGHSDKRLKVRVTHEDGCVRIAVIDNGVGIPPENLTRIFAHGFTTRKDGHGFGLHSGALAAKELGGALRAASEGLGKGAVFTLELSCPREAAAA